MTEQATVSGVVLEVRALREDWGRITIRLERDGAKAHDGKPGLDTSAAHDEVDDYINGEPEPDVVKATGIVGNLHPGESVEVTGAWIDSRYGRELKAAQIRVIVPVTAATAARWLSDCISGVGSTLARRVVEHFGVPALWDVLERAPISLTQIKGISPTMAARIADEYAALKDRRATDEAFIQMGLSQNQAAKLREKWGADAIAKIAENPYQLITHVEGFGFVRADAVAARLGVDRESPARIKSGLMHTLRDAEGRGHCYVQRPVLIRLTADMLRIPEQLVVRALAEMCSDDGVDAGHVRADGTRVYLYDTLEDERELAQKIAWMLTRGQAA